MLMVTDNINIQNLDDCRIAGISNGILAVIEIKGSRFRFLHIVHFYDFLAAFA